MSVRWTIIVALGAGIITGLASRAAGASLVEGLTLIFLVEIVLGIYNLDRLQRPGPETIKHIKSEPEILKHAREMRERAERSLHSIWCSMDYDAALEKYFEEFRGLKTVVSRLINVKARPEDVSRHLDSFINEIRAARYMVTSTRHSAFEFLIADKNEVLFLVPRPTQYGLSEGIHSIDNDFTYAVLRMHEDLVKEGNQLVIPAGTDDDQARAIIAKWVTDCCS